VPPQLPYTFQPRGWQDKEATHDEQDQLAKEQSNSSANSANDLTPRQSGCQDGKETQQKANSKGDFKPTKKANVRRHSVEEPLSKHHGCGQEQADKPENKASFMN